VKRIENRKKRLALWGCLLVVALGWSAGGQEIRLGDRSAAAKGHVMLVSEAVEVRGGHEQVVELRFRVEQGFHINSHMPKDELLIPTVLKLETGKGVDVLGEEYPAGTGFKLLGGEGEVLDVYQGEFRVKVRMVADVGVSTLVGALRYQACDEAACFPPKTLAVKVMVTGK
jgi:hypothetical protein